MIAVAITLVILAQPHSAPIAARPFISDSLGGIKAEIQDQNGVSVSGVRLSLTGPGGLNWISFTNEKGQFKVGELPPGKYRLELFKGKHQSVVYPMVLIKANAWLLGVSPTEPERLKARHTQLTLVGPPIYEQPGVAVLRIRPKNEKIPMH